MSEIQMPIKHLPHLRLFSLAEQRANGEEFRQRIKDMKEKFRRHPDNCPMRYARTPCLCGFQYAMEEEDGRPHEQSNALTDKEGHGLHFGTDSRGGYCQINRGYGWELVTDQNEYERLHREFCK